MSESATVNRPPGALSEYVQGWDPCSVEDSDIVSRDRILRFARTLDLDERTYAGPEVPALWHWLAFHDWPATRELGPDGHPLDGHFYPPVPHRRRMFAGSEIVVAGPLCVDEPIVRRRSLGAVEVKTGRNGELLFVTVRSEFHQRDSLRRSEEQRIVYRSDPIPASSGGKRQTRLPGVNGEASWRRNHVLGPPTLFRVSALTANSHRIHYDAGYATEVEGYPGLVVHGPLLAMLMAELAERRHGVSALRRFGFRLSRPVFEADPFIVEGSPATDGSSADLAVVTGDGTAATARVELR